MTDTDFEQHIRTLFSYGFRPLFICTFLSALVLIFLWIGLVTGWWQIPGSGFDPVSWHAHEMLFGFIGSAIGGFLLTAVANWTRRPPVQGWPLFILVLSWLAARIVMLVDLGLSGSTILLVDVSFWFFLTVLMGREILIARNYRNLKLVAILALFACLNICFHFYQQPAIRATTLLVCILISVIGGRIVPAFTGNWLRRRQGTDVVVPPGFNRFDQVVIAATVGLAICWTLIPYQVITGAVALVTGLLQLARISRWRGHLTLPDPLLLSLHFGYAWLGFGFIVLGLSVLTMRFPASAGIHAVSVGAMAGLVLAVSARAALGHTDRPLVADFLISAAFILINLAAIARVFSAFFDSGLLVVSAVLWLLAFTFYGIKFAPILLGLTNKPTQGSSD